MFKLFLSFQICLLEFQLGKHRFCSKTRKKLLFEPANPERIYVERRMSSNLINWTRFTLILRSKNREKFSEKKSRAKLTITCEVEIKILKEKKKISTPYHFRFEIKKKKIIKNWKIKTVFSQSEVVRTLRTTDYNCRWKIFMNVKSPIFVRNQLGWYLVNRLIHISFVLISPSSSFSSQICIYLFVNYIHTKHKDITSNR